MSDLIERLRGPSPSIPAMRDAADEIERLRDLVAGFDDGGHWYSQQTMDAVVRECADLRRQLDECSQMLARQAAEIERLTASLKRANETAEHFERHWYLRGDEIERLTAERDEALAEIETLRALLVEAGDELVCSGITGVRADSDEEWQESHWCPHCDSSVDRNWETRTKIRAALAQIEQEKNSGSR